MFKSTKSAFEKYPLFFILALGLFWRIIAQQNKDFWFDEAISWAIARQNINQLLISTAADNHPPLYYLFLHFWLKISDTEFFLRVPSLIFGLISIVLVYKLAKLLLNQKIALTSAVLFSLSPLFIYYSSEARMYNLWVMLVLASLFYFLKILKKPSPIYHSPFTIHYLLLRSNKLCLFTIYYLLSLYTHYYSLLLLVPLNLFLVLNLKKYKRKLGVIFASQIIALSLFLPWILFTLAFPHPLPWKIPFFVAVPATYFSFFLGGTGQVTLKTFFSGNSHFIVWGILLTAILFFTLLVYFGIAKIKQIKKLHILFLLLTPLFIISLIDLFRPVYTLRGFIIFAPLFYLLAALGIENIKKNHRMYLRLASIGILTSIIIIQNFYPPLKHQTLKEATEIIEEYSAIPIFHTNILTFYPFQYYLRKKTTEQYLIFTSDLTKTTTDIIGGSPVNIRSVIEDDSFWTLGYFWDEKTGEFKKEQISNVKIINDLEIQYYESAHPAY